MLFNNAQQFKKAMKEYEIHNIHNFIFLKNNADKIRVQCVSSECLWLIFASLNYRCAHNNKTLQVKTYKNIHKCGRVFRKQQFELTGIDSQIC